MTTHKMIVAASVAVALVAGVWGMQRLNAQVPGFKRVELQRHDLDVPNREAVMARGEFNPGAAVPRHTHPGEEIIYILEGSLEYQIEGQPPKTFNAGDALTVPAGVIHAVRNVGSGNAAELARTSSRKGSRCSRWPSER